MRRALVVGCRSLVRRTRRLPGYIPACTHDRYGFIRSLSIAPATATASSPADVPITAASDADKDDDDDDDDDESIVVSRPQYKFTTAERPTTYIKDVSELIKFTKRLDAVPATTPIAVDTEFMSFPHSKPRVELIQLATPTEIVAIDCQLLNGHLRSLLVKLFSHPLILHSGYHDIAIMYQLASVYNIDQNLLSKIFDTQIAASYLGYGNTIAYSKLISLIFDLELNKSDTLTDWSLRPLSSSQLNYAFNDVKHLHQLHQILTEQLIAAKRYDWFVEEVSLYTHPDVYQPMPPHEAWRAIWMSRKFLTGSVHLSALRDVSAWRHEIALQRDRQAMLIMRDQVVFAVAAQLPTTIAELRLVSGIKDAILRKHGADLCRIIKSSVAQHKQYCQEIINKVRPFTVPSPPMHRLSHHDAGRLKPSLLSILTSRLQSLANTLQISPYALASRHEVTDLASVSREALIKLSNIPINQLNPTRFPSSVFGLRPVTLPQHLSTTPPDMFDNDTLAVNYFTKQLLDNNKNKNKNNDNNTINNNSLSQSKNNNNNNNNNNKNNKNASETQNLLNNDNFYPYTLEQEVSMLCRLRMMSGWRRQLVGDDLIKVALGNSLAYTEGADTVLFEQESNKTQNRERNKNSTKDSTSRGTSDVIDEWIGKLSETQRQSAADIVHLIQVRLLECGERRVTQTMNAGEAPAADPTLQSIESLILQSINKRSSIKQESPVKQRTGIQVKI